MAAPTYVFEVSENQGGTTLYLDDNTGSYHATDNTGGYGSPNTARNALALILIAYYKATSGDIELTPTSYDPVTVTQYTIPTAELQGDGWYQFTVYPVAVKTGAETPSLNDFVYDNAADQLERWNGSAWVTATNSELEDNDETHENVHHAHIPDLFTAFNRVNELLIEGTQANLSRTDLTQYLKETDIMVNGSLSYFTKGDRAQFQTNIEKYQSRVDEILEL
jgi:hypothetical protein